MPAPPAPLDNNNLTRQDYADLQRARASGMTGPQLSQEVQQRQNANITRQQQYETRVQQAQQHAQTQANEAERQRIARQTADLALQKAQREEADRALRGPSGDALTNQDRRMLLSAYDNPEAVKTPDYAAAYANLATPRVAEGGLQIQPDMTPFKLPQDKDGNPILSYGQPKLVIGPGDLSKYRAIDEQFSTITYTLDTLKKAWNDASAVERAETLAGKPTALRTAWTNAALLAKGQGLFELGVISGPDKTLLQGALADPSTVWGAFTGSATAGKQIDMVKDLLSQRRAAAQRAYGGGMAIGSGPQSGPVSGTVAPASAAGGWTVKRID
jgi:hypothetical protein